MFIRKIPKILNFVALFSQRISKSAFIELAEDSTNYGSHTVNIGDRNSKRTLYEHPSISMLLGTPISFQQKIKFPAIF